MNERKKLLLKILIWTLAILGVMIIAVAIMQNFQFGKASVAYSYNPFDYKSEIGYSEPVDDIFADEEYMGYKLSMETKYLGLIDHHTDVTIKYATPSVNLLYNYINCARLGDGGQLNSFFTEDYFINKGKPLDKYPDKFAMQKIYNTKVELVDGPYDSEYKGQEVYIERFEVSFYIKDNNGQFRPDLPDDGTIPLVFEVITIEGESKINGIVKYLSN